MPLREEDIKPITATPEWQLARELADPRVGKTEREHYAARRIADLEERIAWMTMRGTDELPRNDLEGNRIREELTGQALVEYLRAQRRAERERAEMAERVSSACDHNIMAVRTDLLESKKTASAIQNRLAATDRNNADLRAKLAEAERERDEALAAVAHMISSGLGAPPVMRQVWAEKYAHLLKLAAKVPAAEGPNKAAGGA